MSGPSGRVNSGYFGEDRHSGRADSAVGGADGGGGGAGPGGGGGPGTAAHVPCGTSLFAYISHSCGRTVAHICGVYAYMCGVYAYMCGLYAHMCGLYAHMCGLYAYMCGLYACMCGTYAHMCGLYACMCGLCAHMCGLYTHMCGLYAHMCGLCAHMCGLYARMCGLYAYVCAYLYVCACSSVLSSTSHIRCDVRCARCGLQISFEKGECEEKLSALRRSAERMSFLQDQQVGQTTSHFATTAV